MTNRTLIPLALGLALLAACASSSKDESPPAKTSLATATAGDLTVELLAGGPLETGLTPVWVSVRAAGGAPVTDATVTFVPVMSMTSGTVHSAPTLAPPAVGADGLYRCDVVFQMASGTMGSWSADVSITRGGAATVETTFTSLEVADSGRAKVFSFTDPVTSVVTKYVASFNLDAAAKVGLNPVTVTLHRMVDMMTFAAVDDAALAIDPQMPAMGHGAPGSVNPTLASAGVYDGQVAFSMAGTWATTLTVSRADVVVGAPVFTTTF
jgi:predicted component of type VI protein secretion system